jgi:nucleoside 2-deoxyribosyltransferase
MLKIYLAGPDVFRQDAIKYFEELKAICHKYGFVGCAPLDNTIEIPAYKLGTQDHSRAIFLANVNLIKECDVILANIEPFRGACIDDGTAWEIGCGYALGKKIWGYSSLSNLSLKAVTNIMFDINRQEEYPIVEDFNNPVNLMISDSIKKSGGDIFKTVEECLVDMTDKFYVFDLNKVDLNKN